MGFLVPFFRRLVCRVSPRLLFRAIRLWIIPGWRSVSLFRERQSRSQLFPPFFFLSLTDACNLRCHGCWITSQGQPRQLNPDDVNRFIAQAKSRGNRFFVLLGGEPFLYKDIWTILQQNRDCYFQIITNALLLDDRTIATLKKAGNATILVSLDGFERTNDARRGSGTFRDIATSFQRLRTGKLLFGVATTITAENCQEVLTPDYVRWVDQQGAMYLWYYIYRPVGPDPTPHLALDRDQILHVRRQLLSLRKTSPIIIIDTYWDADGKAVCPAALGLGYHIGPSGDIELCPPLSFARETIHDHAGDLFRTINESPFLRGFQQFALARTRGCPILECPRDLVAFLRDQGVRDTSGRDAFRELWESQPRASHHIPGEEIPESMRVYRWFKKHLFFGLGVYG